MWQRRGVGASEVKQYWKKFVHTMSLMGCAHAGTGILTKDGQIACECRQCRPGGIIKTASVSCSEFEEHAGSRERRPAESIYLECITTSLKVC